MINLKNDKGVTLAMLMVTIIILFIIVAVTIVAGTDSIDQTIESQDISEMLIVQHAMRERYIEYLETNDESLLVGKKEGESYRIVSSNQKLSDLLPNRTYYISIKGNEKKLYYIDENGKPKEIDVYRNSIRNTDLETHSSNVTNDNERLEVGTNCIKITDNNEIIINGLIGLGITGLEESNPGFKIDYQTGYVKKIGFSEESALKGYNNDANNAVSSNIIDIY